MPKLGSREFPKSVCFDQVPVTAFLAFEHESKYTQSEPQRPFPFQRKGTWVEGELVEEGRQEPTDSIRMQPQHHGHSQASNLPCFLGRLTWWLRGKESACNMRDRGSTPGSGRSLEKGLGYLLQYSCLENSTDRGVRWTTVHRVLESDMTEQLTSTLSFASSYDTFGVFFFFFLFTKEKDFLKGQEGTKDY